jgi:hypothetical protein
VDVTRTSTKTHIHTKQSDHHIQSSSFVVTFRAHSETVGIDQACLIYERKYPQTNFKIPWIVLIASSVSLPTETHFRLCNYDTFESTFRISEGKWAPHCRRERFSVCEFLVISGRKKKLTDLNKTWCHAIYPPTFEFNAVKAYMCGTGNLNVAFSWWNIFLTCKVFIKIVLVNI